MADKLFHFVTASCNLKNREQNSLEGMFRIPLMEEGCNIYRWNSVINREKILCKVTLDSPFTVVIDV